MVLSLKGDKPFLDCGEDNSKEFDMPIKIDVYKNR